MKIVKLLRGKATVIIVAHRLSTIKDAYQVIYLQGGKENIGNWNFHRDSKHCPGVQRADSIVSKHFIDVAID